MAPTAAKAIQDRLARRKTLREDRGTLEQHWQDLEDLMLSRGSGFTVKRPVGDRREDVYDTIPIQAARNLASALGGLLMPGTAQWFFVRPEDTRMEQDHWVSLALEITEQRMFRALYDRQARFIQRTGEANLDLVVFGTANLFTGEARDLNRLLFRTTHLRDTLIDENSDGAVDTEYIDIELTVRQAAQRWGEANLGRKAKEMLRDEKPDAKLKYLWTVQPREDRSRSSASATDMPWASTIDEIDSEHTVQETGFEEFPFAAVRWETASGEKYGRSPGMVALSDAETLQAMGKTLLVGGQRRVDPPIWMVAGSALSPVRTHPGGVTVLDGRAWRDLGTMPMGMLDTGANIPIGREMQNDVREQVWGAFFRNILNIPADRPQMTATEVLERREEFQRAIGPVFGQLETDYQGQLIERVFNIMQRAGAFPELQAVLPGANLVFKFESPVHRARRSMELAGLSRALEMTAPLWQSDPTVLDNFDRDAILRDTPAVGGYPQRWLHSPESVMKTRSARQEQMEDQQMGEKVMGVSEAARNVTPLIEHLDGAAAA